MRTLAGKAVGGASPPRIMGIINASPESFHKASVRESYEAIREAAVAMEEAGADYIDVGGMSTAPYLETAVPAKIELERIRIAVDAVTAACGLPVSVDTCRSAVAAEALDRGASILNDVTGLGHDPGMAGVVSRFDPSLVLCAHGDRGGAGGPAETAGLLSGIVERAVKYGGDPDRMAVDPAIGFFRSSGRGGTHTRIDGDWTARDVSILAGLREVGGGMPVLVSVSNKSFIGRILDGREPPGRLHGSLAAEAAAVLNGADIIRTHNVTESRDAARVAAAIAGRPPADRPRAG